MNETLKILREAALREGFVICSVAPASEPTGYSNLLRWIESGYAGEMTYFADRVAAYRDPGKVLAGARSIIVMAIPYDRGPFASDRSEGRGKIARYAWSGDDYHDTIHPKLKRLCRILKDLHPHAEARGVVDTAPLLEREFAQLAGIGWRGKNTLILNKSLGSYFFLACVLTDVQLPYDQPHEASHCGTCTACLEACPTDAFPSPGVLDATRCISYLTIEHRGHIDRDLRAGIGDWLFGCDVCQEVCPWNRKPSRHAGEQSEALQTLDPASLFTMDEAEFRRQFRKTPLWRTRRRGILRNAAIVLGNQRDCRAIDALVIGLADAEPIVCAASAWALGRIASPAARSALLSRRAAETDDEVRREIEAALANDP